ncbi:MAG: aminotransferase class I/II-fold pyridoxal phosphate-dependent enzyme [Deltaproteobacteria bacterium]|nr:aminotransferase class I/II-fold pyridoxal phosphate-dependent enzyme [Candidatus Anaeroferrophillus wilburensis]MBN2888187.1 aminotransferase class I/II-fold pyridoxal phosphate-dependent enzyme [Deltaproteobacteria bacterium]
MEEFSRIKRLPPYVFSIVNELKMDARHRGEDIVDLGMGNPDLPTPQHIVDKLAEAIYNPKNHRYSASKGIEKLRLAMGNWYKRRYDIELDPDREIVVTIGAKEGISHLALAVINTGDVVFAPSPTYPIHPYSVIIAGGDLRSIPIAPDRDFFDDLLMATKLTWPRPKMVIISYPHNPTTTVVDLDFFKRMVDFAREHGLIIVHDFAYADLTYDGYKAPSILQVDGAKEVAVEFYSLSKSYSMAGWRVGFCVGSQRIVQALTKIKSYLDYGIFQPIQIAAIAALNGDQSCVDDIVGVYKKRRDTLCDGLQRIGWPVNKPLGTMFVWGKIPEQFKGMGSLEFSKLMIQEAKVAVSPGIGFGEYGDDYVRFALVENEHRTKQAIRGIRQMLQKFS